RYEEGETLNKDTLDLAFRGEIEPLRGLRVGALADVDGRVLLQLSLNLERLSVGGQVDVDDGDPGFTTEVVLRSHRLASLTTVRRVALLELSGTLRPAPAFSIFSGGFRASSYGALPLYLERLRQDDEVAGVFARIGPLDIGWGKAEEIRASLVRLRKSGRRVDCELTGTDDKAYFLATACSTIVMPPPIQLAVNGVQAQLLFVKDALDRYGVEAEVYRRDEFKTSPETYIKRGISPAQRKSLGRYIERVNTVLIDSISEGRDLDRPYVEAVLRKGVVTSTEAVALKLIDGVKYPDEVEKWVRSKYSGRITLARGREALQPERPRWSTPPAIAVIHVDATIASGRSRSLPFGLGRSVGAQDLVETIEAVRRSKRYVAAVLRVDSPGGGAYASDIIARAVRKLAKEKPVIASFGDVAASGGYYVASGARVIYAQPMTLTGSIGVFSLRFSAETLFRRLGINAERLGAGVGSPSPYLSATPLERKIAQKGVDYAYQQFLRTVALGRRTDVEKIAAVAGGRVWTGAEAKDRGLVDELGGFVAALQRAKAEAGLTPNTRVQVVDLPGRIQPLTLPSRLIQAARALGGAPSADVGEAFAGRWLPDLTRLLVPLVDMTFTQPKEPLAWFPMSLSVD
ncbi:MAG: signal peptide peptidase SppA, partial [Myxococcota bacterium]